MVISMVSMETVCQSLAVTQGGISLGSRDPESLRDFLVDEELGKTDQPNSEKSLGGALAVGKA